MRRSRVYGYMRVPTFVCMYDAYIRFLVALACWACRNRERLRRVRRVYSRRYRAGHLILTLVITSLLSSRDGRERRDERVTRNLNREINCGAENASATKYTLQNGAGLFGKETNPRLDGFFIERKFTYLLLISVYTLETADNCTALTICRR